MPPRARFLQDLHAPSGPPPTSKTPREVATHASPEEQRRADALTRRLRGNLDEVLGRAGDTLQQFWARVEKEASEQLDHTNPHTKRHHENAKRCWQSLLTIFKPEIDPELHWARDTVVAFAPHYLIARFELTQGKNEAHVKAITVASWAGHIIYCIAYFTFDPDTGYRCGRQVLTGTGLHEPGATGLYMRLIQTVKDLVFRHNLDRFPTARYRVLGKRELQMAIEYAISRSVTRGRGPRLQIITALLLHFGSGARPSSLAAIHKDVIPRRQYLCWGDLEFFRDSFCKYTTHITYRHFKGEYAAVIGSQAKHVYKGLSKVHNLSFDPFWFVAYGFIRGVFEHDNIDDLINSTDHQLKIKKGMEKEPVFIKVKPGGDDFVTPIEPTTADNLSQQVVDILQNGCGIEGGSSYGFRKGAATELEITAGEKYASLVLHHRDALSVNHRHYSLSTATLDLLGLRLGEVEEPLQPGVEERLMLNARMGAAVVLIAGDLADLSANDSESGSGSEDDEGEDKDDEEEQVTIPRRAGNMVHQVAFVKKRAEQVEEQLDESNEIKHSKKVIEEQWPIFISPFGPGTAMYKKLSTFTRGKGNVTLIATSDKYKYEEVLEKASPEVARASRTAKERLNAAFENIAATKKSITKIIGRRIRREGKNDDLPNPSIKDVDRSLDHFEQPSYAILDAVESDVASKEKVDTRVPESETPGAGPSRTAEPPTGAVEGDANNVTGPLSPELQVLRQSVIDIGAEDDLQDEEAILNATKAVVSHPQLSHCGTGQDKDKTLRTYLGMERAPASLDQNPEASTAGPAGEQTDDSETPFQSGLKPMDDEQDRREVVKNMDTTQVRAVLLRCAVAPVLADRAFAKQVKDDDGQIFCTKCDLFPKYLNVRNKYSTRNHLERHLRTHTEWHDLELRMQPKAGKSHGCPAAECHKGFDSIKEVKKHCLSDECPEHKGFRLMKEEDDMRRAEKNEKETGRGMRLRDREALLGQSARALLSVDEEQVKEHARHFGVPAAEIRSDVVKRAVELAHTLGNDWLNDN